MRACLTSNPSDTTDAPPPALLGQPAMKNVLQDTGNFERQIANKLDPELICLGLFSTTEQCFEHNVDDDVCSSQVACAAVRIEMLEVPGCAQRS